MDYDSAILAHSRWKNKLKDHIEGKLQVDPVILGKDDQCELGKWLHAEAKDYAGVREFKELLVRHARFHDVAAGVVRQAHSCSPEKALELLQPRSEYGSASSDCVNALAALRKAVSTR